MSCGFSSSKNRPAVTVSKSGSSSMEIAAAQGFSGRCPTGPGKVVLAFEGELGRRNRVIAGRLHHHPQGIQKHGLRRPDYGPPLSRWRFSNTSLPSDTSMTASGFWDIPPGPVPQRDIDAAVLGYGKAHAGNGRLMRVQRGPLLRAVVLQWARFQSRSRPRRPRPDSPVSFSASKRRYISILSSILPGKRRGPDTAPLRTGESCLLQGFHRLRRFPGLPAGQPRLALRSSKPTRRLYCLDLLGRGVLMQDLLLGWSAERSTANCACE